MKWINENSPAYRKLQDEKAKMLIQDYENFRAYMRQREAERLKDHLT